MAAASKVSYILGMLIAIPLISIVVAALSAAFSWRNYSLSSKLATRSLFLEGQKFVLEIDRQLLSDPHLWYVYDDYEKLPPDTDPNFNPADPLFQAKLRAFAYLHLNMFEVILAYGAAGLDTESKMWMAYFYDTLARSSLVRRILDQNPHLWNEEFFSLYRGWKDRPAVAAGAVV
jgi:hypothetical protein